MKTSSHVDWLSLTFPLGFTLVSVLPRGMAATWEKVEGGLNGYMNRAKNLEFGITGLTGGNANMGLHVIENGENLARIRDAGISDTDNVKWALSWHAKAARIDLALDVRESDMTVENFASAYDMGLISTKAQSATYWHSLGAAGQTLYIGKRTSSRMLRIYDKAAEQGIGDKWIRIELECKNEYARAVAQAITRYPLRDVANRAILEFMQYPSSPEFVEATSQSDAAIQAEDKPITNTYRWLMNVVAPALAKYEKEHPADGTIEAFMTVVQLCLKALTS